jgi:phage terminase large subunit-like protein
MSEKYGLIRESAEASLEVFIRLVAPHMLLGGIHQELIQWWNRQDAKPNQLVLLPRGHLKSKLVAYRVAWWITKHPETTILYVSATADLAEKQLFQIKQILDNPIYKRYWPSMLNPDIGKRERWAVEEIAVDHPNRKTEGVRDPTCKACGLKMNTTGFHADVVVLDDIVVPANAYTEEGRDTVAAAYSQLASIENPEALEWVVGTRYHPRDIYDTMINMKAEIFDDDGNIVEEDELYELFQRVVETEGEFLWPRQSRADGKKFGFDERVLSVIKGKYVDQIQFFSQYYNNPNTADTARISAEKFQYYERNLLKNLEGDWYIKDRKLSVYAAIDFAFSLAKKADSTAIVVVGVDHLGNFYVLDIDRFKTSRIVDYYNHIVTAQQKWGFRKIRAEINVAQKAVVEELKSSYIKPNGLPLSIDEHNPNRHQGDKEERMAAVLEPKYDNLQVWHYKGGNCQLLEEELVMAHPPHDDIKDSLANAISIAIIPKQRNALATVSNISIHPRFGGVF